MHRSELKMSHLELKMHKYSIKDVLTEKEYRFKAELVWKVQSKMGLYRFKFEFSPPSSLPTPSLLPPSLLPPSSSLPTTTYSRTQGKINQFNNINIYSIYIPSGRKVRAWKEERIMPSLVATTSALARTTCVRTNYVRTN